MIRMNHQYPDAGPRRKCFETFRALPATARFTKTVLCRLSYGGVVSRTRSESRLYGRHAQFTTRAARGQDIPVGYAAEPAQGYIDRSPFDVPRSGRRKLFLPVYETADPEAVPETSPLQSGNRANSGPTFGAIPELGGAPFVRAFCSCGVHGIAQKRGAFFAEIRRESARAHGVNFAPPAAQNPGVGSRGRRPRGRPRMRHRGRDPPVPQTFPRHARGGRRDPAGHDPAAAPA
jgi:hypothetical protein